MPEEPVSRRRARELWDTQSRWNAKVAIYDNAEVRDPEKSDAAFWRAGEMDAQRLAPFFAPGARVLDLGCGMGRVLRPLAARAGEVIGVDISREMLDLAEKTMAGVPHARLILTPGASLEGVAERSVDFLYSLLCLIHVDRRSAYRYLEEIQRVLRPGALAFLQFQDVANPSGLAKFREVLDLDYPLEFYTEEEVRFLLESVGLDVVTVFGEMEYLYFTVIRGDAARWRAAINAGIGSEALATDPAGGIRVALRSKLPSVQPLRLVLSVTRGGRPQRAHEAIVDLAPGVARLEVSRAGPGSEPAASLDGRELELVVHEGLAEGPGAAGDVEFHAALLPPGFRPTEDFADLFPALYCSWRSA